MILAIQEEAETNTEIDLQVITLIDINESFLNYAIKFLESSR